MNRKTNPVNIKIESGSGKNADDSSQLKGEAKRASSWNAKNEQKEYSTASISAGKLGGQAQH